LINPCNDKPEEHFEFVFDPVAKLATVVGKTTRGQTTEKILGLNRSDLRQYRSKMITTLYVLSDCAKTDPEAQTLIAEACQDESEYAAFARSLIGFWHA
jgi:hypothetical protein